MNAPSARPWRSAGAVFAGLLVIFATHNGLDQVMHSTGVFPPRGEPMTDSGQYVLAFGYRVVFSILGCYVTAWLAPRNPMRHALILGGIGVVLGSLGAYMMWGAGPIWYPVALVLVALPCAWAGGAFYVERSAPARA